MPLTSAGHCRIVATAIEIGVVRFRSNRAVVDTRRSRRRCNSSATQPSAIYLRQRLTPPALHFGPDQEALTESQTFSSSYTLPRNILASETFISDTASPESQM